MGELQSVDVLNRWLLGQVDAHDFKKGCPQQFNSLPHPRGRFDVNGTLAVYERVVCTSR